MISRIMGILVVATAFAAPSQAMAGDDSPVEVDDDEAFLAGPPVEGDIDDEGKEGPSEEEAEDGQDTTEEGEKEERKRDHRHQGFANVLFGIGWYMVAPYDKDVPEKACGWEESGEGEPVCSGRSPMHLDILAGFGVKDGLEIFAMFRTSLPDPGVSEFLPEQTRYLGAGIKTYSPSDGLFKIAFGVAPLFDFSKRDSDAKDFVIHVPIAAHFDFIPWLGAYAQVSPNISFISEFKLDISLGIGVQGRFP
jgi:hypothetical protein